jgi:hypothetical protein
MYMFTSQERPINQLGPFEKPRILVMYIGIFMLISFHILHELICKFSDYCILLSQFLTHD